MELVATVLILSFIVASTMRLYQVGQAQQWIGRDYSQVQTDLREGLRRAMRALRHGYGVVMASTEANFPVTTSDTANQVIVTVPNNAGRQIRIHRQGDTLYAQRADEPAPGLALITGVQTLRIRYWQTVNGVRSNVDGSPGSATEVTLSVEARRGRATTRAEATVAMRNKIAGL